MIEGLNTYLELSLFIDLITSSCFALILGLIKIPRSAYSESLYWSKQFIAGSFTAVAAVLWFTLSHKSMAEFHFFATLMMLVVTGISAAVMSYSLISLLDDKVFSRDGFIINVIIVTAISIIMARLAINGHMKGAKICALIFIIVHIIQCSYHIVRFDQIYKKCKRSFQDYYDEDEDKRIRWIRFCYIIMMLTDLFILAYVMFYMIFQNVTIMIVYILFYSVFMLYFTSNYISFLSNHKILLDAFAHDTLVDIASKNLGLNMNKNKKSDNNANSGNTAGDKFSNDKQNEYREREFVKISKRLEDWVAEKKYREYDKSREEIAQQLKTSKDMLQLYFNTRIGKDFRTWRTELRIEDAKRLLLEDRKASINLVSDICGFSDRSNFHRQFTKIVGCSPKEWRENNGKSEKN